MTDFACGCECHDLDPNDNNYVVLNDKQWSPLCALRESVRQLGLTQEKLNKIQAEVEQLRIVDKEYKNLVDGVRSICCPHCRKKIGDKWAFDDNGILCTDCMKTLYPHYF